MITVRDKGDKMSSYQKGIKKYMKLVGWVIVFLLCVASVGGKEIPFVEGEVWTYGQDKVHTYVHQGSGLKVIWIENKDKNKSFTLGVKTPTVDSTGVNHIIEHTIFTGSKKYPSSTLFFDASSQYPHLFMNAMTTSDLTLYPFATPYEACFKALLEIYLDSILHPNMLEQPYSFYEESFHYNPISEETAGVVFNEMKGASTHTDRILFRMIRKGFYKGTHYENDSGGEVCKIPTLTYEQFVETYKSYYYPANMMIVMYGDLPIHETLKTINSYFKDYTLCDRQVEVNVEASRVASRQTLLYEKAEGKKYLVKAFRFRQVPTPAEELNMDLWLHTYLMDSESLFMKRLEEAGVKQVQLVKDTDLEKPLYAVVLIDIKEEELPYIEGILNQSIKELLVVKEDKEKEKRLLAKEKMYGIALEEETLKGIRLGEMYIDEWSHHKPEHRYYKNLEYLEKLQDVPDCREVLFTQMDQATLYIKPSGKESLCAPMDSLQIEDKEWGRIIKEMTIWQQKTKQQKLKEIPLDKLVVEPSIIPFVSKSNDVQYILTESDSPYISHRLYLPTGYIEQEQLPYLFLYGKLLQKAADDMMPYKGEVAVEVMAVEREVDYRPYLKVTLQPIAGENPYDILQEAQQLMLEKEDEWYLRQIHSWTMGFKEMLSTDLLGSLRMLSKNSQSGAKRYLYEAEYPLYQFCKQIKEEEVQNVIRQIKEMKEKIFFTDQAAIGITGRKEVLMTEKEKWEDYVCQHKLDNVSYNEYKLIKNEKANLYYKDSPVDYLLCTYDKEKQRVEGEDYVVAAYLTHYYLQPRIRIKKGAYGAGMYALYPNTLAIYTYRDPNFKSSIEIIEQMVPIARECLSQEKLNQAKVTALGQMQRQFRLLDTELSQISWFEKLIVSGVDIKCIKKLQQDIIHMKLKTIDNALERMEARIEKSHISLCTDHRRMQ